MLINDKTPTIVGILTFMSRINFVLSWAEYEKSFITSRSDWGVVVSSLTGGTALCPWARHYILCFPANRKRFHNVFVWLYRGFVATQRCVNVFITFSIRCGKVVLEPTTGKRCRNVWFPTLPKHACMTCCQTKVFGFIATFYKLKLLSLYDRSSDNVYKTFCYNIYNVTLATQFRIPISVGFFGKIMPCSM